MTCLEHWFICPNCETEGPHKYAEDEVTVTCLVCGYEYEPTGDGEEDDEHESSLEEQFENNDFAHDEYPAGYDKDDDFFGDE